MESQRFVGDCRDVLRQLIEDGVKVQCVVTSPPYWGLRDYGTGVWEVGDGSECEHIERLNLKRDQSGGVAGGGHGTRGEQPASSSSVIQYRHTCAKCGARRVDKQIGLEALHDCLGWATGNRCGECHVCVIVDVFRLVREVLADDGTVWLNYGDAYASSGSGLGQSNSARSAGEESEGFRDAKYLNQRNPKTAIGGLKPKDLVGMPWRVALALQADGWYLRSDIIWAKPNPMPESCTDRPTKSHEYLFLLSKRGNYFYDAEAVREKSQVSEENAWRSRYPHYKAGGDKQRGDGDGAPSEHFRDYYPDPSAGRNRRTVWTIATESFSEAHFATFPRALVTPCILAGTSQRGHCPECGARWVRVVEKGDLVRDDGGAPSLVNPVKRDGSLSAWSRPGGKVETVVPNSHRESKTIDWRPTCTHNIKPIPDIVLDPFGGSGTVGAVAEHLGRKWILIDLSESYAEMQKKRTAQTGMAL